MLCLYNIISILNSFQLFCREIVKNSSVSSSQAKQSLQTPVETITSSDETKVTSQPISAKDSKTKVKDSVQASEDKKEAQSEAKFLLRELLLRAEVRNFIHSIYNVY